MRQRIVRTPVAVGVVGAAERDERALAVVHFAGRASRASDVGPQATRGVTAAPA